MDIDEIAVPSTSKLDNFSGLTKKSADDDKSDTETSETETSKINSHIHVIS